MPSQKTRWVYLATAPDQLTAELWANLLQGDGFPVLVRDDYPRAYLGVVLGPCRLLVREDCREEAQRRLAEYLGAEDRPR